MEMQRNISANNNERYIGQTMRVIIDDWQDDFYVGRSQYDSPEVDQQIWISSDKELKAGDFVDVKITSAEDYDLYGVQV